MILLEMKCPQLSKPEATAARNENYIGSIWGFSALLKGTSVVALYILSPHRQSLPDRDSN